MDCVGVLRLHRRLLGAVAGCALFLSDVGGGGLDDVTAGVPPDNDCPRSWPVIPLRPCLHPS